MNAQSEPLDLAVSFVLYRTSQEEVDRAIAQVLQSDVTAEVLLIDNSPEASDVRLPDDPRVRLVHQGVNLGYGRGHNIAIRQASPARYHLVLNTDVAYGPEVLPKLVAFMDAHPEIGLAAPRVVYPDGSLQHLCRLLPDPADLFARGFLPNSGWAQRRSDRYEFRHWAYDEEASFPFLSGCFMFLRRSVLDRVGGFDERFFLYGEDIDLSRRVHQIAGTMFVPWVEIEHEYRTKGSRSFKRFAHRTMNLVRYFNKWGWIRDPERARFNRRAIESLPGSTEVRT